MNPNNGQDVYLEPAVEINHEIVDPLGATQSAEPNNNVICSPGGC